MSASLQSLYQELILEHNRYPRNYGRLEEPTHEGHGYNPLCGDEVHLTLKVQENYLQDIKFEGKGCAICRASASMMTTLVKGQSISDIDYLFEAFHELVTQEEAPTYTQLAPATQEKLQIFATVRNFPVRVKCATLPWHTLHTALHRPVGTIATTE
ncbi:MAG: SUF system NifU family Fe-S cluster assembly protein [Bacteroidia bacterium]|nr:SUF system NifU family Fe-S cluster assembly protein [Bacteroidia bacterium]MDW8014942.1 SUF system NifU family Fe-S cluster assembly protein [Bacteroidia bacterium]